LASFNTIICIAICGSLFWAILYTGTSDVVEMSITPSFHILKMFNFKQSVSENFLNLKKKNSCCSTYNIWQTWLILPHTDCYSSLALQNGDGGHRHRTQKDVTEREKGCLFCHTHRKQYQQHLLHRVTRSI